MKGIDVSCYQEGMDLSRVKRENGVDFVIIRLGYGVKIEDNYLPFYNAAMSAGIPVGAYFYSLAVTEEEAIRDARRALSIAGGRPFPLGVYMDVESGSQLALRDSVLTSVIKAFCDTIRNAGYKPGVYGSALNVWAKVGPSYLGDDVLVWKAAWDFKPANCDIWQTSENGRIQNIKVDTDEAISERFIELIRSSSDKPVPSPEPVPAPEPDTPITVYWPPRILCFGMKGTDVSVLQALLCAHGYATGINGTFGGDTVSSVLAFQNANGLAADGIAGPITFKALGVK